MNDAQKIDGKGFKGYAAGFFRNPRTAASVVIGVTLLVAVCIASYTFYAIRIMDNQLSVTGSAKKAITADKAKWSTTISRPVYASSLSDGYTKLAADLKVVKAYFAKNGFDDTKLDVSTVFMDEVYENQTPSPENKKYTLRQTITVNSDDVQRVSALSKNVQDVIAQGVIFSVQAPEYSFADLASLRVELLAEALKDAEARASSIASVTGNSVGKLKSAASGVVQVLTAGSNDVSDYGTYDTSSIDKEVMVTVRASFNIK